MRSGAEESLISIQCQSLVRTKYLEGRRREKRSGNSKWEQQLGTADNLPTYLGRYKEECIPLTGDVMSGSDGTGVGAISGMKYYYLGTTRVSYFFIV